MDYFSGLMGFVGVLVGSAITLLTEMFRSRAASRKANEERVDRRTEALATLYTEFMVTFDTVLMLYESFYEGIRMREQGWQGTEPDDQWKKRADAATRFRQAVWRLRVQERNGEQKRDLENIVRAFDFCFEDLNEEKITAFDYPEHAKELRAKTISIIDRFHVAVTT